MKSNHKVYKRSTALTMIMLLLFYYVSPSISPISAIAILEEGIYTSSDSTLYYKEESPVAIDSELRIHFPTEAPLSSVKVVIQDVKEGDVLDYLSAYGIDGEYDSLNGILTLTGTASSEQYEKVLQSVSFSTVSSDSNTREIAFILSEASFSEHTKHYYEYVHAESPISWEEAKKAAETRSLFGKQGYLATSTSKEEQSFLDKLVQGPASAWLGAKSSINEDNVINWQWVTGPEGEHEHASGKTFYSSPDATDEGCVPNDVFECNMFTGWAANEPSKHTPGESMLQLTEGYWHAKSFEDIASGYLVEFGSPSTDTVNRISLEARKQVEVLETTTTVDTTLVDEEVTEKIDPPEMTDDSTVESKEVTIKELPIAKIKTTSFGCTYSGARAVYGGENGTELFLGGNFIELGISNWGDFGTFGDKPNNFRGTVGGESMPFSGSNKIGMSADHDGFCNGRDLPVDYYLPGTPEERFAVGYKVGLTTETNSNSVQMGNRNMPTIVTNQSNTSTGDLKAKTISIWDSKMEVTQVISFKADDKFYRNDVTIKNTSTNSWDSARYMRSFDPDNSQFRGGQFVTANTVTHTYAEDGKAVVKAETIGNTDPLYEAFGSRIPIFFYSNDPAAKASVFGFSNSNPYVDAAYITPAAKGNTITNDIAITMTWDSGPLAAGESKTFTYYTSLDERDFDDVQKEIFIDDVKKDIQDLDDFDDVKKVKEKIDMEKSLEEEKKKELKTDIIDILLHEKKDILIRGKEDIELITELIHETDLSKEEKDDARKDFVKKITDDIEELTVEEEEATKALIADIVDPTKKEEAENYFQAKTDVRTPAEKAIEEANNAQERYEDVEGDVSDELYNDVETAKNILQKTLNTEPLDKKKVIQETEKLAEVTLTLEEAIAVKELENAKRAAEDAINLATKAEDRYDSAEGDLTNGVYSTVEAAKKELQDALVKEPADKEEIIPATEKLVKATNDLEKASDAKELDNAKKDAEATLEEAEKAKERYKLANGEESSDVYLTLETVKNNLQDALGKTPANTKDIESATNELKEAVMELVKASNAKELENAKNNAEEAILDAIKQLDRYKNAAGEESDDFYIKVVKAKKELQDALNSYPANIDSILSKTESLNKLITTLTIINEEKELKNAKFHAESAIDEAKKIAKRYELASGDLSTEIFTTVDKSKKELQEALNTVPADKDEIQKRTEELVKKTLALEVATSAKELDNAIKAAEGAIDLAAKAEDRYELAEGELTDEAYVTFEAAKKELQAALVKEPADNEEIITAKEKLVKATTDLEKASDAKELDNAKKDAEATLEEAEKTKERYNLAGGDESKKTFTNVKDATEKLQQELETNPAITEKIVTATVSLKNATATLNIVAADKELENEIAASKNALEKAQKELNFYIAAGGKNTDKAYQDVISAKEALQKTLQAEPPHKEDIQQARKLVEDTTLKIVNDRVKKEIEIKIKEAKSTDQLLEVIKEIDKNVVSEHGKSELYTTVVDKLLNKDQKLLFTDASQIIKMIEIIELSTKTNYEKQRAIVKVTEKAIVEVAKKDQPAKGDARFQHPANQAILDAAHTVNNATERNRLIRLLELTVDARSLSTETAFVFAKEDTWESITSKFIMLAKGQYGSSIEWKSNRTDVIQIADSQASVARNAKDQSVILSATLSNGKDTIEKTFLLVVKSNAYGKKETENGKRDVLVEAGSVFSHPPAIQRINLWDSNGSKIVNKIDKLIIDQSIIREVITEPLVIYMADDKMNRADEIAVEIPLSILEMIQATLTIKTDQGSIIITKETLEKMQLDGKDLFFRIVPIRQTAEKNEVIERLQKHELVMAELSAGQQAKVLGTPREIETNYKGYDTTVILPLDDVEYTNIENLRIFIEHTDGERKVVIGDIVVNDIGKPIGLQFTINKFSTFTIFEIVNGKSEQSEGITPPSKEGQKPTQEVKKPSGNDAKPEEDSEKSDEGSKKLPNTATSTHTFLLMGLFLLTVGLVILSRRKGSSAL
ncbi:LPXTG cell wall anchor domain-containing protein [Sutcliffiella horikoshii]|uniref:immunoglobulin-like domain-containing protein n=1 Tax=Sutcliffiella horikoshii TaxID=79883 RepID=UPI00203FCEBC|nr:immunoglobulin-like domain-containing protein [Sutcliffiella horikoshii]MCM3617859.1 LPXTG cell wall anchor domain-containing protein [Sutcliffiella horikoshii]